MTGEEALAKAREYAHHADQYDPMFEAFASTVPALADLLLFVDAGARAEEREACAVECDGERMACERHAKALPKAPIHQVGIQIADVCARRIRRRGER